MISLGHLVDHWECSLDLLSFLGYLLELTRFLKNLPGSLCEHNLDNEHFSFSFIDFWKIVAPVCFCKTSKDMLTNDMITMTLCLNAQPSDHVFSFLKHFKMKCCSKLFLKVWIKICVLLALLFLFVKVYFINQVTDFQNILLKILGHFWIAIL